MKKGIVVLAVVLVLLAFAGCSSSGDIVGTWVDMDGAVWEFQEDGVLLLNADSDDPTTISYQVSGKNVSIGSGTGSDFTEYSKFEIDGNELKNGDVVIMTKQ